VTDIDFRKRCAVPCEIAPGVECERLYYGLTAADLGDGGHDGFDVIDKFDHSNGKGRRPGQGEPFRQHFFNRRIE
jgi:hypothetical protein